VLFKRLTTAMNPTCIGVEATQNPDESLLDVRPLVWDESFAPGWGKCGASLHTEVPPEYWCITKKDLRCPRVEFKKAAQRGAIKPTDLDPFNPDDEHTGPNIYTCVDQYIRPVTKAAGDMSMALLFHPKGLKCDLFITHAWIEGVFEFINKVLASWPTGKSHAYCCMFSNPQNLNISDLIACPQESPFAKCLRSASHMLVVPNHRASIYTRLWCVYEAFLAYDQDKTIFSARAPFSRQMGTSLSVEVAVYFVVEVGIGCIGAGKDELWRKRQVGMLGFLVLVARASTFFMERASVQHGVRPFSTCLS